MPANKTVSIENLDFEQIKSSLRSYLQSQDKFKDYNFEGSALSVLIDLLSANTHYGAYYAHVAANETFIDSAETRSALLSISKVLGYLPRSISAPAARVTVNFGQTKPDRDYVQTGDVFTSTVDGTSYNFIAVSNYRIELDAQDGNYKARNVVVKEGTLQFYDYVVDSTNPDQRFIIPNQNADISTLVVRVSASTSDLTGIEDTWTRNQDITTVASDSKVYFVQANEDNLYEIYFGDNIVGLKPENGNVVILQYLQTQGPLANGAGRNDSALNRRFKYAEDSSAEVIVQDVASGGSTQETEEEIRFNAPLSYQAQNRAVTRDDYSAILSEQYPSAESVYVWGGEDNDPPRYGAVFIAIKPQDNNFLTSAEKDAIAKTVLQSQNILTVTPIVVDPDFLYVKLNTVVTFEQSQTNRTISELEQIVENEIRQYANTTLERFDADLRLSRFGSFIDKINPAFLGSVTTFSLEKRITPSLGQAKNYTIRYANGIQSGSLSSTEFRYTDPVSLQTKNCTLKDNSGRIQIVETTDGTERVVIDQAGTVDYISGEISLVSFRPISIDPENGSQVRLIATPSEQDIIAKNQIIITIDDSDDSAVSVRVRKNTDDTQRSFNASGLAFPFDTDS